MLSKIGDLVNLRYDSIKDSALINPRILDLDFLLLFALFSLSLLYRLWLFGLNFDVHIDLHLTSSAIVVRLAETSQPLLDGADRL